MASSPVPFKLAAIVLAAGASSRMGTPKLLLPWGQTSILGHLLDTWTELGVDDLAVIIAPADTPVPGELDRLRSPARRIVNPQPARGMFSSIQCAAAWPEWSPAITHWAIVLGDQPQLSSTTLSVLLTFAAANAQKICQPARAGRPRHPVILPAQHFFELKTASQTDLRIFLQFRKTHIALCEIDDPNLDLDLDTPGDYARAMRPI